MCGWLRNWNSLPTLPQMPNLISVTKKCMPRNVVWSLVMLLSFECLKSSLCDHVKLTIPVSNDVFILCTDASSVGVGSVLSVVRHYVELPVAFYS